METERNAERKSVVGIRNLMGLWEIGKQLNSDYSCR
jgi:hypothetical protein